MRAHIKGDIVIGLISGVSAGGVEIPEALSGLPIRRLRVLNDEIVDASDYSKFYIDQAGLKHVAPGDPAWQELECAFDERLICEDGIWRAAGANDELEESKSRAKQAVDSEAEHRRNLLLTPGSGQALTYLLKEAQAKAFLAAQSPALADYPLIEAEVGITAASGPEVAQSVLTASASWLQYGAAVEKARLGGKKAISAAESKEAVQEALNAMAWPEI